MWSFNLFSSILLFGHSWRLFLRINIETEVTALSWYFLNTSTPGFLSNFYSWKILPQPYPTPASKPTLSTSSALCGRNPIVSSRQNLFSNPTPDRGIQTHCGPAEETKSGDTGQQTQMSNHVELKIPIAENKTSIFHSNLYIATISNPRWTVERSRGRRTRRHNRFVKLSRLRHLRLEAFRT